MPKKATLSSRKRNKDAENKKETDKKKEALLAMKEEEAQMAIPEITLDISSVITRLHAYYKTLTDVVDHNRKQYSINEQRSLMLKEFNEVLKMKAAELCKNDIEEEACRILCQNFVDKVREGLIERGVPMNPLHISAARTSNNETH